MKRKVDVSLTPRISAPCTPSNSVVSNQLPRKPPCVVSNQLPRKPVAKLAAKPGVKQKDADLRRAQTESNIFHDLGAGKTSLKGQRGVLRDAKSVPELGQRSSCSWSRDSVTHAPGRPEVRWDDRPTHIIGVPPSPEQSSSIWVPQMGTADDHSEALSVTSSDQRRAGTSASAVTDWSLPASAGEPGGDSRVPIDTPCRVAPAAITPYEISSTTGHGPEKPSTGNALPTPRAGSRRQTAPSASVLRAAPAGSVPLGTAPQSQTRRASSPTLFQLSQASQRLSRLVTSGTRSAVDLTSASDVAASGATSGTYRGHINRKWAGYGGSRDAFDGDDDMLSDDVTALPFPPSPTPRVRSHRPHRNTLGSVSGRLEYGKGVQTMGNAYHLKSSNNQQTHRPLKSESCFTFGKNAEMTNHIQRSPTHQRRRGGFDISLDPKENIRCVAQGVRYAIPTSISNSNKIINPHAIHRKCHLNRSLDHDKCERHVEKPLVKKATSRESIMSVRIKKRTVLNIDMRLTAIGRRSTDSLFSDVMSDVPSNVTRTPGEQRDVMTSHRAW